MALQVFMADINSAIKKEENRNVDETRTKEQRDAWMKVLISYNTLHSDATKTLDALQKAELDSLMLDSCRVSKTTH